MTCRTQAKPPASLQCDQIRLEEAPGEVRLVFAGVSPARLRAIYSSLARQVQTGRINLDLEVWHLTLAGER